MVPKMVLWKHLKLTETDGVRFNSQFQPDEMLGFIWLHLEVIFTLLWQKGDFVHLHRKTESASVIANTKMAKTQPILQLLSSNLTCY